MFHLKSNYIMTKIYVVNGKDYEDEKAFISNVFTNFRKAESYRNYLNLLLGDTTIYWITTHEICNIDYKNNVKALLGIMSITKQKRGQK